MDFRDIEAVQSILKMLAEFQPGEQQRILRWAIEKLGLDGGLGGKPRPRSLGSSAQPSVDGPSPGDGLLGYATVADVMAAAQTTTPAERALVVATFLQYRAAKAALTGFEINSELKHLGHAVGNITDTLEALQTVKPALVIQVRKAGTTRQARKQYKVTDAGYRRVLQLIEGSVAHEES